MPHPVVRWQIVSPKPDVTTSFYGQLFHWQTDPSNNLGYRQIRSGDGGIDGGVWPGPDQSPPLVQLFVSVPDVERVVARATQLGAKVLVPASVLPDGDRMAVLLDPVGMSFGVCTLKKG